MRLNTRTMWVGAAAIATVMTLPVPAGAGQQGRQANRRASTSAVRSAPRTAPATRPAAPSPSARTQARPSAGIRTPTAPPPRLAYQGAPSRRPVSPPYATSRGYAVPRTYPAPHPAGPQHGYVAPRASFVTRGIYLAPRVVRFSRPYYAFQPRVRLSFGISLGYPVAYPYGWYDPFAYPRYPSYYGYGGYVVPSRAGYGGLSFDIQPYDAALFVDGVYVGTVGEFSAYTAPLTLAVGLHHLDLTAEGFHTLSFDITVVGGQVIPYQGTLSPIR